MEIILIANNNAVINFIIIQNANGPVANVGIFNANVQISKKEKNSAVMFIKEMNRNKSKKSQ
jgi:hypothetical protein